MDNLNQLIADIKTDQELRGAHDMRCNTILELATEKGWSIQELRYVLQAIIGHIDTPKLVPKVYGASSSVLSKNNSNS